MAARSAVQFRWWADQLLVTYAGCCFGACDHALPVPWCAVPARTAANLLRTCNLR
jgi:hypothetical protein